MKSKRKLYFLLFPCAYLAACLCLKHFIVINLTDSMPRGIYFKVSGQLKAGDIVLFCLNKQWQRVGLEQHYLMAGKTCHGAAPLLKQIIAVPGNHVYLRDHAVIVNSTLYPYRTLATDHYYHRMVSYPRGDYRHTDGFWVIGATSQNSWDSRYWGPLQEKQIISKLMPFITW